MVNMDARTSGLVLVEVLTGNIKSRRKSPPSFTCDPIQISGLSQGITWQPLFISFFVFGKILNKFGKPS